MRTLPSLNALRVFEEVSRHRSFNRAADALHITQGAVSRQIRRLEDYLGILLFIRTPRGLSLTEAGAALSGELNQSFDRIEGILRALKVPDLHHHLRVLAPPTWATRWLSPRLPAFCRQHPRLRLSVTNQNIDEPPVEFDCRIRFGLDASMHGDSQLLATERHIAVAAPSLWRNGEAPSLRTAMRLHILHEGKRLGMWDDWQRATATSDVESAYDLEYSPLDQVIHTALAGGGLAVVDRAMIETELANGSLRPISPEEVLGPYGYWLDIPADKCGLSKVESFRAWLQQASAGLP